MRSPISETSNGRLCLLDLLFGFDSSVENGTVSALAEDFLMKRSLAALALDPEVAVVLFVEFEFLFSLDVNLLHAILAVAAHNFLVASEQIFTPEARFLDLSKFE